jgi:hypothetical protein
MVAAKARTAQVEEGRRQTCALCHQHPECIGCPVAEYTGAPGCRNTPYLDFALTGDPDAAKQMLDLLHRVHAALGS